MIESGPLREEAERCLRLARSTADQEAAAKLTAFAAEYLDSAQTLERLAAAQSALPVSPQQQPAQQQQQVSRPRKKKMSRPRLTVNDDLRSVLIWGITLAACAAIIMLAFGLL
jgi:hypothetical protein